MMNEDSDQVRLLKEILKWTKFTALKQVKPTLESALDSNQKRQIYQLSDGNKGSVEIAQATGVSDWTVRNYWRIWARQGLVEPIKAGRGDRYVRSFDLEDYGIAMSKTPKLPETLESPTSTRLDENTSKAEE